MNIVFILSGIGVIHIFMSVITHGYCYTLLWFIIYYHVSYKAHTVYQTKIEGYRNGNI